MWGLSHILGFSESGIFPVDKWDFSHLWWVDMKQKPTDPTGFDYDPSHVLEEIAQFIDAVGISETTFGRLAVNDSQVVGRIRVYGVTLRTVKKIRAYMAAERAKAA